MRGAGRGHGRWWTPSLCSYGIVEIVQTPILVALGTFFKFLVILVTVYMLCFGKKC
jgi:hypothetical protein